MAGMPVDPVESLLATLPADNEMQTISPPELYQAADTIAKQAMGLSDTQRISLLRRLKQKNQAVWSLVKVRIEDQRNQFRQQGQVQGQQAAQDAAQQSIQPPLPA
jgi:predicted rRNA methylase YqxC with S4 and FtsJ domains